MGIDTFDILLHPFLADNYGTLSVPLCADIEGEIVSSSTVRAVAAQSYDALGFRVGKDSKVAAVRRRDQAGFDSISYAKPSRFIS